LLQIECCADEEQATGAVLELNDGGREIEAAFRDIVRRSSLAARVMTTNSRQIRVAAMVPETT